MKTAVFAHPKETLPEVTLLPGKQEFFSKLRDRDIHPVVTFGGESAFHSTGIEAHELTSELTTRPIGEIALDNVGVFVNRLDRLVKHDDMPLEWSQHNVPTINENKLRSLVTSKHSVQEQLLTPFGLGMPTLLAESATDAAAFMELNPAAFYIVKPNTGTFSKGIEKLPAGEVILFLMASEKLGRLIIQPAYNFTHELPTSITPYDAESVDGFEAWAHSSVTKELRMYGFHGPQDTQVFPVGRAMQDGEDHWFFVDPESVPQKLFDDTKNVLSRAAQLTGSRAIYGALDIGYGQVGDNAPDFHVVELNGKMPYLIGYDKHQGVADALREHAADHIEQTIHGSNGTI